MCGNKKYKKLSSLIQDYYTARLNGQIEDKSLLEFMNEGGIDNNIKDQLVNKEFMSYDDYMEQKEAQKKSKETGTTGNVVTEASAFDNSDDLPF